MAETVLYDKQDHIVTITLNRPDALNSINRQLRQEFGEAIQRFDGEQDSYVAIITGAGRAFCAGRDLKERAADNAEGIQAKASASMSEDLPFMWPNTWKPTIAAVNGFALAGGWSIAQMCDLRVASEDAQLGITETKWSLLPPFGTTLPKSMPLSAVLELVLTAQPVTAQRAYEMGFLNRVVAADQVMPEARKLAEQIAGKRPPGGANLQRTGLQRPEHDQRGYLPDDLPGLRTTAGHRGLQRGSQGLCRKAKTPMERPVTP